VPISNRKINDIIVYHDETYLPYRGKLRGHIFLFVPIQIVEESYLPLFGKDRIVIYPSKIIYKEIKKIRKGFGVTHKFHFSNIGGMKWSKENMAERGLIDIGVEALKQRHVSHFNHPLFCKIAIIFYPNPRDLSGYQSSSKKENLLRYDETLMRILLKGAVHLLYNVGNVIKVLNIFCDGEPHHRKFSEDRVLKKLVFDKYLGITQLRDYVIITEDTSIIHLNSNHRYYDEDSEEYIHANFLQLADMMLGAVINCCFKKSEYIKRIPKIGQQIDDKRCVIAFPVKEMLDKRKRGRGFVNSGHYKTFSLSAAEIVEGIWKFNDINTKEITISSDSDNLTLIELDS